MRLNENYINRNDYRTILKLFSDFDYSEDKKEFIFEYKTQDLRLKDLKEKFHYLDYIVVGKEFRTMVNLMRWVSNNLIGNGECVPPNKLDANYILSRTKEAGIESNCFMYAIVLNEIFLSMGYLSRMVRCMPMDLQFRDCHCMTEVYCREYNKWVVFDAANQAYYVDKKMNPLNIFEIRQNIIMNQEMYVPMMSRKMSQELFGYLTKNMVRFESYQISQVGIENRRGLKNVFHFQSTNFPVEDKVVQFPKENIMISHIHTSNPNLFWQVPISIEI